MLKEKLIVVTGAAGKLGKSFVNAIADNGAVAIAADIDLGCKSALQQVLKTAQLVV